MQIWKEKYFILENKTKNKVHRRVACLLNVKGRMSEALSFRTDWMAVLCLISLWRSVLVMQTSLQWKEKLFLEKVWSTALHNKREKCEKKINCKGYREELSLWTLVAERPERRGLEEFPEIQRQLIQSPDPATGGCTFPGDSHHHLAHSYRFPFGTLSLLNVSATGLAFR